MSLGISSFVRQGIYLLALFFFISIVINAVSTGSVNTYKASRSIMTAEKAFQLMDIIISRCFNGTVNETMIDFYSSNPDKLRECAKTYDFEYWVEIVRNEQKYEKFSSAQPKKKRYIVMVIDTSKSMDLTIGTKRRIEVAKEGIRKFIDSCTTSKDVFGVISYMANVPAGQCSSYACLDVRDNLRKGDLTGSGGVIGLLSPRESNTPLVASLKKAIEMVRRKSGFDEYIIILFTDGGDTCMPGYYDLNNRVCEENARLSGTMKKRQRVRKLMEVFINDISSIVGNYPDKGKWKVYTVGFALTDSCKKVGNGGVGVGDVYGRVLLADIAELFGGKYFDAYSVMDVKDAFCKSLQSLSKIPPTRRKVWEIGKLNINGRVISTGIMIENETGSYPGYMKLHVLDSDEVMLIKRIELACEGVGSVFEGEIADIDVRPDAYCFDGACIPRQCKKAIEPSTIKGGRRKLFIIPGNVVRIK